MVSAGREDGRELVGGRCYEGPRRSIAIEIDDPDVALGFADLVVGRPAAGDVKTS